MFNIDTNENKTNFVLKLFFYKFVQLIFTTLSYYFTSLSKLFYKFLKFQ
jgi:hypothetical protein